MMWQTKETKENEIRLCWIYHKGQHFTDQAKAESKSLPMPDVAMYEGYCLALFNGGRWYFENRTALDEQNIIVLAWAKLPEPYRRGLN